MHPGPDRRRPPGHVRVRLLVAGVGVVVAAATTVALGWWPGGSNDADEAVEAFTHVHGLEVAPWDPDAVYVSTHHGLVRIDEHDTWRWVGEERHDFMGFSAHPAAEGVLYSSGHPQPGSDLPDPIGFMVSTDGGRTWQPRALAGQTDFHAMAAGPDGETIYGWNVAGEPWLHRSDDGGHNWEVVPTGAVLAEFGGVLSLAVSPEDPDTVWAGLEAGLVRSADAGDDWQPVRTGAAVTAVAVDPTDPDRVLAYLATSPQGLVESGDGGERWSPLGLALDDDAVAHLAVHPHDPDLVYAGTIGEDLLRSRDGGQTWEALARAGRPDGADDS